MRSGARGNQAVVARLAAEGANPERIADSALSTWRAVDTALAPIIGHRGVAALYRRSLHLTRAAHPWLAVAHEGALQSGEFDALQSALSRQTGPAAAAAHGALLQTFRDLLTRLLGGSLAERLLQSVSDNPSSGHAAQDASS